MKKLIRGRCVHYLGPVGSYSHLAAKKLSDLVDDSLNLVACDQFSSIVQKVLYSNNNLGLIPIENSSTSSIYENLEYLFSGRFWIAGQVDFPVNLSLIAYRGSSMQTIKEVYSHHKALEQSSFFIESNKLILNQTSSTSVALDIVKNKKNLSYAAIASACNLNKDLSVVVENVNNYRSNITKFFLITGIEFCSNIQSSIDDNFYKFALIITLKHSVGSLCAVLNLFLLLNINIFNIQSKPIPGEPGFYYFLLFAELVDSSFFLSRAKLTSELSLLCQDFKFIGSWE